MTIFEVGSWVVKTGGQDEFMKVWKRFLKYIKENPKMFKEAKSVRLFTQTFGGISDAYVELVEYDSLANYEKFNKRIRKDEKFVKMYQEFLALIEPISVSSQVWTLVQ